MAATDPVSEADLDEAFETSPEFGIQFLDSEFRERVWRHIKRCGRGFFDTHGDDLLDVYQETLIGMYARAKKAGFDPCRSLRMVLAIARNKATDLLRHRGHRINLDEDAILDVVAADTKGSDILLQWRLHSCPIEARELREILLTFIATLPKRQRVVAQCFIDNFEDFRKRDTYRPLADAVSAITGVTESVADVKNDWRYAREKIIAELQRRGYTYITVE
jgi:DNA-directed RNA polymerase specialized sigma24 family protein